MANGTAGRPANVFLKYGGDLYSVSEVKARTGIEVAKKGSREMLEMFLLGAGTKQVLPKETVDLDKILERTEAEG